MHRDGQSGAASQWESYIRACRMDGAAVTPEEVAAVFRDIRQQRYLVHMIPNAVSAALCADGIAALGARPLMAVAKEEMEEIVAQADACVVNLGQLSQEKLFSARLALQCAAEEDKPLVIDPVGCGASSFRLKAVQELFQIPWKGIVKGNRSEIYSIQQGKLTREGIDSLQERGLEGEVRKGSVYLVTGKTDCILWEGGRMEVPHQEACFQNVVGSGCLAGAVAGACSAAARGMRMNQREQVAAAAAACLGMAFVLGRAGKAKGYGTVKSLLLDGISMLSGRHFLDWLQRRELWENGCI